MSKRILAWIALALAAALAAAGLLWSTFGTDRLVFTEADVQERLSRQLPRTIREVTIERVTARLADNRIALRVEMKATILRQPISAVVSGHGVPRYDAPSGELYFDADEVKIDQLIVGGTNMTAEDATRGRLTETIRSSAQGLIEAAMKGYLSTRPVFRFKDDFKGVVLKAALVDVAIEQSNLVVTFSLWNLTLAAAAYVLTLLLIVIVIIWLIRNPNWGLPGALDV
jgi:hypothetical protein